MSTAQLYFPERFYAHVRRTLGVRVIVVLSLVISICCAAIVFVLLYNLDKGYPIAQIRAQRWVVPAMPAPSDSRKIARPSLLDPAKTTLAETQRAEPIARTHRELLALERLGERSYVEFSVARSAGFQPVGPIELAFWRSESKHASVQLSVILEKRRIDFKRVKMDERISLPSARSENLELVINRMTRNQIAGYVSERRNHAAQYSGATAAQVR
jgi:hypothetical protein